MPIRIVRTLSTLRGERIALVPTRGALHGGHLALVRSARRRARRVIVSIFVNPAQFMPNEDFASYPRSFDADVRVLGEMAVDLVWAPAAAVMYPPGFVTRIVPDGPATAGLENHCRPGAERGTIRNHGQPSRPASAAPAYSRSVRRAEVHTRGARPPGL